MIGNANIFLLHVYFMTYVLEAHLVKEELN